jgi:PAS domain S-box-containing protein
MSRVFSRLPLPVKLMLIGLIPLALLIYTTLQIYSDKKEKINLLSSYIDRIHQSADINTLVDYLEKERKYSFDYAMRKDKRDELMLQRPRTDSAIHRLEESTLSGFTSYTFLENLQNIRDMVDKGYLPPEQVMHYYTTALFRINTLNVVSPGVEIYLQPVYKNLVGQKLLSEMITNLGIMRSNIYNVLYTKKYMVETLGGMIGVHDVYKTYETEFLLKASPAAIQAYKKMNSGTSLKSTVAYLDTLFKRFKPDSSYTADAWWKISDEGMQQLRSLRQNEWNNVVAGTNTILKKEKAIRSRTLILIGLGLVLAIGIMVYTILSISRSLVEMKWAAQKIAEGDTNLQLHIESGDVIASLAQSIARIDANNKLLADAADAIGKGNFDVAVEPRGKKDILGNAVVRMKDNLLQYIRVNKESSEQLGQLAEKYKTIFYKSPLAKWIYDFETLQFLEVNEAALRLYGYSQEEFLNMSLKDIRPKEEQEKLLEDIEKMKHDPTRDTHGPWKHIKKNGELFKVEVSAHFIEYNKKKARLAVITDITDKLRSEEQLKQSHEELRNLASRLQDIREEERASIAREVHDVLGQQITCLKMDISWLSKKLSTDPGINERLKTTLELLDQTALTIRKIATELRPSILDDFGLVEALEWQSSEFEKRSGITIKFSAAVPDISIPKNITIALFRIYQESLTNVARHADATTAVVKIELKNKHLILTIADNGKGFDVNQIGQTKTLGLLGMKERTLMMGGKYEVSSMPGAGTIVTIIVPLAILESTDVARLSY